MNEQAVKAVNNAHKKFVKDLSIDERVFKTSKRECFLTLKDHNTDFKNSPSSRLPNPTKCEVGRISHQSLSKLVEIVKIKAKLK